MGVFACVCVAEKEKARARQFECIFVQMYIVCRVRVMVNVDYVVAQRGADSATSAE